MRFDPFNWSEVKPNVEIKVDNGRLQLLCSVPSQVYVTAQGYEVLAGVGQEVNLQISEEVTFRIESDAPGRYFVYQPERIALEAEGEVFTNADRMIEESGTIAEIRRELRAFELERRETLREIRMERAQARQEFQALQPAADAQEASADAPEPLEAESAEAE